MNLRQFSTLAASSSTLSVCSTAAHHVLLLTVKICFFPPRLAPLPAGSEPH